MSTVEWTYEEFMGSGWDIQELAALPPEERPRIQTGYLKTVCFDRDGEYNVWRRLSQTPKCKWDDLPGHCVLKHEIVYHCWEGEE